jgi:hypothetical protein
LYDKKELTYPALIYLFLNDYLHLSNLEKQTLMVDDISAFSKDEWKVLNKLFSIFPKHILTYDRLFLAYSFLNSEEDKRDISIIGNSDLEDYIDKYQPEQFNLQKNYRSEKGVVDRINTFISEHWSEVQGMFTSKPDDPFIEKRVDFIDWLKKTSNSENICLAFRTNRQLKVVAELVEKLKVPHIILDRDFFKTKEGEKYIYLFKYILSIDPSDDFTKKTYDNFVNDGIDVDQRVIKRTFLKYKKNSDNSDLFRNFKQDKGPILNDIINYLFRETGKETINEVLHEFLDNQDLYPYYDTHYHNKVDVKDIHVYLSTFHRLKQIKQFDYVVYPNILDDNLDELSLVYMALSKCTKGYGLFDFELENRRHKIVRGNVDDYSEELSIEMVKEITIFCRHKEAEFFDALISHDTHGSEEYFESNSESDDEFYETAKKLAAEEDLPF